MTAKDPTGLAMMLEDVMTEQLYHQALAEFLADMSGTSIHAMDVVDEKGEYLGEAYDYFVYGVLTGARTGSSGGASNGAKTVKNDKDKKKDKSNDMEEKNEEKEKSNKKLLAYYIFRGDPIDIILKGGQVIEIEISNQLFGTLASTLTMEICFPISNTTDIVLPYKGSRTYRFDCFGEEPMTWRISFETISDAALFYINVYSSWRPGDSISKYPRK